MSRWIDIDDDRNCYCGCDGEYEKWSIDPDVLADAKTDVTERKNGYWISSNNGEPVKVINGIPQDSCYCSVCGDWLTASDEYSVMGKYCPSCGADMRKSAESEPTMEEFMYGQDMGNSEDGSL